MVRLRGLVQLRRFELRFSTRGPPPLPLKLRIFVLKKIVGIRQGTMHPLLVIFFS